MTKRHSVNIAYFFVVIMILLLRVSSSLGAFEAMGVDGDIAFTLVCQLLCFGVLPIFLYLILRKRTELGVVRSFKEDFGIKKVSGRNCLRTVVLAICMIFIATMFSFVWQNILSLFGFKRVSTPTDYSSIGVLFLQLFLVAVLPGIFEEITHRGLLYAGYRQTGWRFVLVSALLFSLMHQNIVQTGYTFFDGIVIALVMYYTGSIFPGIFIHFFNNMISVLQSYAGQNGGIFSFVNTISDWFYSSIVGVVTYSVLLIVAITLMIVMFKRMRDDAVKNNIIDKLPFASGDSNALQLHRDALFIVTVLIGICATTFTLVWGIWR